MSKLKLKATALCAIAALALSLSSPPAALAHKGAMGIVKERMDKFEASEKATKRIKQALSRGDTAVVTTEAKFLVSWAREMDSSPFCVWSRPIFATAAHFSRSPFCQASAQI